MNVREVLFTQPNRVFVYVLTMSENTIRIVQFDRSGAQFSQAINYHHDPVFFMKFVVLFSSLHDELPGYDTSISSQDNKRLLEMIPDEVQDDSEPGRRLIGNGTKTRRFWCSKSWTDSPARNQSRSLRDPQFARAEPFAGGSCTTTENCLSRTTGTLMTSAIY
ncbi:hypothetical protein FB451DRAFT_599154 [Mycena latifolia]|nr:hypothetical protein FB451DRAFT_599154 [Mycena latifolia]